MLNCALVQMSRAGEPSAEEAYITIKTAAEMRFNILITQHIVKVKF